MSSRSSSDGSWGKRKSVFALTALRPLEQNDDGHVKLSKTLKKARQVRLPALFTDINNTEADYSRGTKSLPQSAHTPKSHGRRPSLTVKAVRRAPLALASLKNGVRATSEEVADVNGEPLSAASSTKESGQVWEEALEGAVPSRTVLLHGEVQTSAGMFRKKVEYLVLTETHLIRFKSQAKAAECFKIIQHPVGRSNTPKHGSMPSIGSLSDIQTSSDSSGDKDGKVPLTQVVATYRLDDGKPYFAIEVCCLDEESVQASAMTLQFGNPEERDYWLRCIRDATVAARARDTVDISPFNLEYIARLIERDNDYDPSSCSIYKVVQRNLSNKSSGKSSTDDISKVASTVCFLAIGVHKLHIIPPVRSMGRSASPALSTSGFHTSHGLLTLSALKVNSIDDSFELIFRQPLQKAVTLSLASATSHEITARLHFAENFLRPACGQRLFKYSAPSAIDDSLPPPVSPDEEEHSCLDRTLTAYCIAYGVNPANIRYTINYQCDDSPRFELLPPADPRRPDYGPLDLLAIVRALRYNESFGGMSFAGIRLDSLNGLHDNYGQEMVCWRTKRGTPIKLSAEELGRSSLLVQEVRALAATSKRLRHMDFSGCITARHTTPDPTEDEPSRLREIGCGIVEALFPLCKHQTTNVDWICLNGIELCDTDLDYLVGAAVVKACHFRAIELNRCGLTDRSMGLILDALRVQENTLESLELAGNTARLSPITFDGQLSFFGFIRKLNLSHVSVTSGADPLLQAETLLMWKLQELRLSGTTMNSATIGAIATYLAHPQSSTLRELYVDNAFLTGAEVATLLHSLAFDQGKVRDMHIDISQSQLSNGIEQVTQAISNGLTPSHLTMKGIDYKEEAAFRKMIAALTGNKKIRCLDMSQTALPNDASDETCRSLERLLAENDTLLELDISGDDSRLATSVFGSGINQALRGLKQNKTMRAFHVEKQKLRLPGASALAEVLKENRTLQELYCDNNEIPLHGLTDLVNSLIDNTTLIHLSQMDDGRAAAFRDAEATMKVMSDPELPLASKEVKEPSPSSGSMVRRGFASVRRTAQRSASSYTPSFPALPSYTRSTSSPDSSKPTSPINLQLPPPRSRQGMQGPIAGPIPSFTVQDIQTTHRLLTEQWDRQCYRLAKYLERNWCLLQDIPCNMEVEDEKFERPASVGSIGKLLEQVRSDTTPRVEKDVYFDASQSLSAPDLPAGMPTLAIEKEKGSVSFKQFLLQGGPQTPDTPGDLDDLVGNTKQLRIDSGVEQFHEPRTPTQQTFAANA